MEPSICMICMQKDLLLKFVQSMDDKLAVIHEIIFKSACIQVCSPCEQQLCRSYRFLSLCRLTSDEFSDVCDKDAAVCIEPQNRVKVEATPGKLEYADNNEEIPEDLSCNYKSSTGESKDEIDFGTWRSNIDNVVDLTLESDVYERTNEVVVSLDVEEPNVKIEKYIEGKGVLQYDEDIKIEILDHELELAKEEPPMYITSEQSNESYDVMQSAVIIRPNLVIPKIKCYLCSFCKEAFLEDYDRQQHLRKNHQEKIAASSEKTDYKCETCESTFVKELYLKHHLKFSTCGRNNKVQCKLCSKFINKCVFKKHMTFHEHPELYSCKLCNKSFSDVFKLKVHIQLHIREKTVQCQICKVIFSRTSALVGHMKIYHQRIFKCEFCGIPFTTFSSMWQHVKVCHRDIWPYKCDICDQIYKTHKEWNTHKLRHENILPNTCKFCENTTSFRVTPVMRTYARI